MTLISIRIIPILCSIIYCQSFNWTVYNKSNSILPSNAILDLHVDKFGNKWISLNSCLIRYSNGVWTKYDSSNSNFPKKSFNTVTTDSSGNVWLGSGTQIVKYDGNSWTTWDSTNAYFLGQNITSCIRFDKFNRLWVGTSAGLFRKDDTGWVEYRSGITSFNLDGIRHFAFDSSENLWAGVYDDGLGKYDGGSWTVFDIWNSQIQANNITYVAIENGSIVWVGEYGGGGAGVSKFDGKNWTNFNSNNSPVPHAYAILIDSNKRKWIGGSGLQMWNDTNWMAFDTTNSPLVPYSGVSCLALDLDGSIWVGTKLYGIAVLEKGKVFIEKEGRKNRNDINKNALACFPSVANKNLNIVIGLSTQAYVYLSIYDSNGREIAKLFEGYHDRGGFKIDWNFERAPSGIYFAKLKTDLSIIQKSFTIIR